MFRKLELLNYSSFFNAFIAYATLYLCTWFGVLNALLGRHMDCRLPIVNPSSRYSGYIACLCVYQ